MKSIIKYPFHFIICLPLAGFLSHLSVTWTLDAGEWRQIMRILSENRPYRVEIQMEWERNTRRTIRSAGFPPYPRLIPFNIRPYYSFPSPSAARSSGSGCEGNEWYKGGAAGPPLRGDETRESHVVRIESRLSSCPFPSSVPSLRGSSERGEGDGKVTDGMTRPFRSYPTSRLPYPSSFLPPASSPTERRRE